MQLLQQGGKVIPHYRNAIHTLRASTDSLQQQYSFTHKCAKSCFWPHPEVMALGSLHREWSYAVVQAAYQPRLEVHRLRSFRKLQELQCKCLRIAISANWRVHEDVGSTFLYRPLDKVSCNGEPLSYAAR